MKQLLSFFLLVLSLTTANAQSLTKYSSQGKIGFKNTSGEIVVPAQYDEVYEIGGDKYYCVELNHEKGVLDKKGKVILEPKYSFIWGFSEGLFSVEIYGEERKRGFADTTGKVVIPLIYQDAALFSEGICAVMKDNKKWGFIDKTGKEITEFKYDKLSSFSDGVAFGELAGKYGLIDKQGKEIVSLHPDGLEGFTKTFLDNVEKGKNTGHFIFDDYQSFSENLGAVKLKEKYGFIDKSGAIVIPIIYDRVESFYKGTAIVLLDKKMKIIDKTGKTIKDLKYSGFGFSREDVMNVKLDGKYGRIESATGKEIFPPVYSALQRFQKDMTAWAQLDGKWGMIDKSGKVIVPFKYNEKDYLWDSDNLYKCRVDNKFCFFDEINKKELTEVKYDSIGKFKDGFVVVRKDNKFGYVDMLAKELVSPNYRYARAFSEGLGTALNDKNWLFVNKNGEEFPLIYNGVSNYNNVGSFHDGLCWVFFNDKAGYVNKKGKLVIALEYDAVWSFDGGIAKVQLDSKIGCIDLVGNEVIPIQYDKIDIDYNGIITAVLDGKEFYFNSKGQKTEKPKEDH